MVIQIVPPPLPTFGPFWCKHLNIYGRRKVHGNITGWETIFHETNSDFIFVCQTNNTLFSRDRPARLKLVVPSLQTFFLSTSQSRQMSRNFSLCRQIHLQLDFSLLELEKAFDIYQYWPTLTRAQKLFLKKSETLEKIRFWANPKKGKLPVF